MMRSARRALALIFALMLPACYSATRASLAMKDNPHPGDPKSIQRGAHLYKFHCAGCHGDEGYGDGDEEPDLMKKPPNLHQIAKTRSEKAIASQILTGDLAGMPPHRGRVNDAELWDITNYVISLGEQ